MASYGISVGLVDEWLTSLVSKNVTFAPHTGGPRRRWHHSPIDSQRPRSGHIGLLGQRCRHHRLRSVLYHCDRIRILDWADPSGKVSTETPTRNSCSPPRRRPPSPSPPPTKSISPA
jgi:hypothetical protein